ncbi:MAG: 3-carboxymuconate cyclase, partial [Burkholderiales bacterium]
MTLRSLIGRTASLLLTAALAACGGGGDSSPASFTIGGSVTGLAAGTQVVLSDNGNDPLAVNGSAAFTFSKPIAANGTYVVTITTQPVGQTCSVANFQGAGVTANVTNVNITCAAVTHTIAGTVTGLAAGQSVVLNNNGADPTTVSADGAFAFVAPVAFNGSYAVTVATLPTGQMCTVSNGSGAGVVADITDVAVTCSTNIYTIGGAVTGLASGQQVTLNNNASDPLTLNADGTFTFPTAVSFNGGYAVTVGTQPTGQTCTVANGSGAGVTADIADVAVTCSTNTFTIGGTVTGLASGQQVTLNNNGANPTTVLANGAFEFSTPVNFNSSYAVTVATQPTGQTCSVSTGTGAGVTANVTTANISCSTNTFTIGGTVTGLASGQQVTLFNNGGNAKTVTANGAYTFSTPVNYNGSFAVTVGTQPTGQTCSVSTGTGAGVTANVTTANISCSTNTFTIGGTVTGLASGQQVTVFNNGGNAKVVTANGAYTFTTPVNFNGSYAVTVNAQPTGQTCS